ncbi:MAG: sensor histidine kinase [Alphaproteobacteria bacterium]
MRLAEFIRTNQKAIVIEWEDYARTCPGAPALTRTELRDNIIGLLDFIAKGLEEPQTRGEREAKAKSFSPRSSDGDNAAEKHAEQRFRKGFDTLEMISEFRVLRATIVKIWSCPRTDEGVMDLNRFNEAIDQVMMESLVRYMENEKRARSLFLGTLIHDLRNPVNAISQAAQLMGMDQPDENQAKLVAIIQRGTKRIGQLATQLIDAVRIRLGKGMPTEPEAMNIGDAAIEVAEEIRVSHPAARINIMASGDLNGEWDPLRMRQMFSSLIGNAVHHGGGAVEVGLAGEAAKVVIAVHNTGNVIPAELLPVIFDPLTRGLGSITEGAHPASLGLGLFITREIVAAHVGRISVTSTLDEGTVFTVALPKKFAGKALAEDAESCEILPS